MTTHRYAVLIQKPERERLMGLTQSARFDYLRNYTTDVKDQLLNWLDARDLRSQVESVDPETVFNTLFFTATPAVKRALAENPIVLDIAEDKPVAVELMWKPQQAKITKKANN